MATTLSYAENHVKSNGAIPDALKNREVPQTAC